MPKTVPRFVCCMIRLVVDQTWVRKKTARKYKAWVCTCTVRGLFSAKSFRRRTNLRSIFSLGGSGKGLSSTGLSRSPSSLSSWLNEELLILVENRSGFRKTDVRLSRVATCEHMMMVQAPSEIVQKKPKLAMLSRPYISL